MRQRCLQLEHDAMAAVTKTDETNLLKVHFEAVLGDRIAGVRPPGGGHADADGCVPSVLGNSIRARGARLHLFGRTAMEHVVGPYDEYLMVVVADATEFRKLVVAAWRNLQMKSALAGHDTSASVLFDVELSHF